MNQKNEKEATRGRDTRGKIRDTEREAVLPPRPAIGSSPGNTKAFFGVSPAPHTHTHSHTVTETGNLAALSVALSPPERPIENLNAAS